MIRKLISQKNKMHDTTRHDRIGRARYKLKEMKEKNQKDKKGLNCTVLL